MENTARLFNCARCRCQVVICSRCDRGNIYCGPQCSQAARRGSLNAAGRRYQRTRRGRHTHAARQRRYRSRREKVTHQGSPSPAPNASLVTDPKDSVGWSKPVVREQAACFRCSFCGCRCSAFVRQDFLHRRRPYESQPIPDRHAPPWPASHVGR